MSDFMEKFLADSAAFENRLFRQSVFSHRDFLELAYGEWPLKGLDIREAPLLEKKFSIRNTLSNKSINRNFRARLPGDWGLQADMVLPLSMPRPGAAMLAVLAATGMGFLKHHFELPYYAEAKGNEVFYHLQKKKKAPGATFFMILRHEQQHVMQNSDPEYEAWAFAQETDAVNLRASAGLEEKSARLKSAHAPAEEDRVIAAAIPGFEPPSVWDSVMYYGKITELQGDLAMLSMAYYRKHGFMPGNRPEFHAMLAAGGFDLPPDLVEGEKYPRDNDIYRVMLPIYADSHLLIRRDFLKHYLPTLEWAYGDMLELMGDAPGQRRMGRFDFNCRLAAHIMNLVNDGAPQAPESMEAFGNSIREVIACMTTNDIGMNYGRYKNMVDNPAGDFHPSIMMRARHITSLFEEGWEARHPQPAASTGQPLQDVSPS